MRAPWPCCGAWKTCPASSPGAPTPSAPLLLAWQAPVAALTSAEMAPARGTLLLGALAALVHPQDVAGAGAGAGLRAAASLACKSASTLLDIYFTGQTQLTRRAPAAAPGREGETQGEACVVAGGLPDVVNVDTCLVACARCGAYLGDGQLDTEAEPSPPDATSAISAAPEAALTVGDLCSLRLALHCVAFSAPPAAQPPALAAALAPVLSVAPLQVRL